MAQQPLITPADLLQRASSSFLSQFVPRPLIVSIVAGGALGVMQYQWQVFGDPAFGAAFQSEAGVSWSSDLDDPGYGTLTFAAGSYVEGTNYFVGAGGITTATPAAVPVTPGAGAIAGLSAVRFDLRFMKCESATSKGCTWMLPRVVGPVTSVGPQIKEWLSDVAIYDLKSRQGMTPPTAGTGDENYRARAEDAERNLKMIGASQDRPPDIVDATQGDTGAGLTLYPSSAPPVGWPT